ncbi:MAG: uroporphyrinogen-III C-methyltransferase, partial [Nitrospirae bacterium]|nr:uroporphyrinogen-III C-methyltransferase [Nitrospirota bacterium]
MKNRKTGKVYLVGAGPGDIGLLTLKGKECIEKADVIIYDYLANEEMLSFARPDAERIFMGKHGGGSIMPQKETNRLMITKAKEGKMVVRLKGGDPFIFGRGGEEAEFLVRNGISFEVVPGVTAGSSAPAYAGIPLTHRSYSSTIAFITGHEDTIKKKSSIAWDKIATGMDTIVIFMGITPLPVIAENLIRNGRSPS